MELKEFILLLKSKGTGATMGQSLSDEALARLPHLFQSTEIPLAAKCTMLTAILTLPPTPTEAVFIQDMQQNPGQFLPSELHFLVSEHDSTDPFHALILKIISGQALSTHEAQFGIETLFNPEVPNYLKAAFLEGLRLRRETLEENHIFYKEILKRCGSRSIALPLLLHFSAAYDGYNRNYFLLPFVACVLASLGIPVLLHGVDEVSPKRGMNSYKLLTQAHKSTNLSLSEASALLMNPEVGWAYVDQKDFFPELFQLKTLRQEMVKRPFLSTLEKLVFPLLAEKNYLLTSYTHPPYRATMTNLLKDKSALDQVIIVRGTEGGIQLGLDRKSPWVSVQSGLSDAEFIHPSLFGLSEVKDQGIESALDASIILDAGIKALSGKRGLVFDLLIYQVCSILFLFKVISDPVEILQKVTASIDDGLALRHWQKGQIR